MSVAIKDADRLELKKGDEVIVMVALCRDGVIRQMQLKTVSQRTPKYIHVSGTRYLLDGTEKINRSISISSVDSRLLMATPANRKKLAEWKAAEANRKQAKADKEAIRQAGEEADKQAALLKVTRQIRNAASEPEAAAILADATWALGEGEYARLLSQPHAPIT